MTVLDNNRSNHGVTDEKRSAPDLARRRLYAREEALLRRMQNGEDTPELRAALTAVREAIRRNLRHEHEIESDADEEP